MMGVSKILFYSLLSFYATVNSSNKIALTFDTQCITACTGSPNEETSIDQLTSQLINSTIANTQAIKQILEQVNNLANTVRNTAATVEKVSQQVEELTELQSSPLPTSCQEIKQRWPNSASGVYLISNKESITLAHYVYCYMEELCGSDEGWTRIAYLNMSDLSQVCPSGFRLHESGGVRACGRPVSSGGSCASVKFPSNGITYSEVCGRVVGYRYNTLDYPGTPWIGSNEGIDSYYLDGISLTHGSPRKHIWSFVRDNNYQSSNIQSFIGNDYFCENTAQPPQPFFYTADPLWDGKDCDQEPTCCNREGFPWFHKVMKTTTNDYIELRVCCNQDTNDEDVPFGLYELYIKS